MKISDAIHISNLNEFPKEDILRTMCINQIHTTYMQREREKLDFLSQEKPRTHWLRCQGSRPDIWAQIRNLLSLPGTREYPDLKGKTTRLAIPLKEPKDERAMINNPFERNCLVFKRSDVLCKSDIKEMHFLELSTIIILYPQTLLNCVVF